MRCRRFALLLVLYTLTTLIAELSAQTPTRASITRQQFNQVFVKVIIPVTERTPRQEGPAVESWVAEQLKEMGESEYFAVTDWVPVCDGLLTDDIINNSVWDGRLGGKHAYFSAHGDIPERENGRLMVMVNGWLCPAIAEVNITLSDEPGSRAVGPVLLGVREKERKRIKIEEGLPYVAVIIAPPPREDVTSRSE